MNMLLQRCDRHRENLCLLASGVPVDTERSVVENHLASCAGCKKYYDEMRGMAVPLFEWEKGFLHVAPNQKLEARWEREFQTAIEPGRSRGAKAIHSFFDWLNDVVWPCRRIWSGFAAVWLGIFAINLFMRGAAQPVKSSRPPAELVKAFLDSQRRSFKVELENPAPPAGEPSLPQARSERHSKNFQG